jgi:pimeloyl-ACP methyl ester carboxylesterase
VLDLVEGDRRRLSSEAVKDALGGTVQQIPEVYAASSPLERLPLGVPQLVVQCTEDDLDLVDMSRRYARAAGDAGDEAVYLERPGHHFAVIDPASPIWKATADELATRLGPSRG